MRNSKRKVKNNKRRSHQRVSLKIVIENFIKDSFYSEDILKVSNYELMPEFICDIYKTKFPTMETDWLMYLSGWIGRGRVDHEIREIPEMISPWKKFPEYDLSCMGWRMGNGQAYLYEFAEWYSLLPKSRRILYRALNPQPEEWRSFYNNIENDIREHMV